MGTKMKVRVKKRVVTLLFIFNLGRRVGTTHVIRNNNDILLTKPLNEYKRWMLQTKC